MRPGEERSSSCIDSAWLPRQCKQGALQPGPSGAAAARAPPHLVKALQRGVGDALEVERPLVQRQLRDERLGRRHLLLVGRLHLAGRGQQGGGAAVQQQVRRRRGPMARELRHAPALPALPLSVPPAPLTPGPVKLASRSGARRSSVQGRYTACGVRWPGEQAHKDGMRGGGRMRGATAGALPQHDAAPQARSQTRGQLHRLLAARRGRATHLHAGRHHLDAVFVDRLRLRQQRHQARLARPRGRQAAHRHAVGLRRRGKGSKGVVV